MPKIDLLPSIRYFLLWAPSVFLLTVSSAVVAQTTRECKVKKPHDLAFEIAYKSPADSIFSLRVAIERRLQTDTNLIRLARYIKNKYCGEDYMAFQVFDTGEEARKFAISDVKGVPETMRAVYYLDRNHNTVKLARVKIVDDMLVETLISLH